MLLETSRLFLQPCTEELLFRAEAQGYENGPEIKNHVLALAEDPELFYWGSWIITRKKDDAMIGDLGFKGKPGQSKTVEIGYGLLEQFQNKGYATEAVEALIFWAWSSGKVSKIIAETDRQNKASMRVLQKLKMRLAAQNNGKFFWELSFDSDWRQRNA